MSKTYINLVKYDHRWYGYMSPYHSKIVDILFLYQIPSKSNLGVAKPVYKPHPYFEHKKRDPTPVYKPQLIIGILRYKI